MSSFSEENAALLVSPEEEEQDKSTTTQSIPRRNTKKELIAKIKELCETHEIPLTESDTTLQRSSKLQLQKMLAAKAEEVVEKKMRNSIRNQHIEQSECAREHMAVATLQYGLTVLNKMIDRGANTVLPRAGYKLEGFMEAFEDPRTQEEVQEILLCICRENPEIITHIANPYVRLGIVYVGAVSMSMKKLSPEEQNVKALGSRSVKRVQTVRFAHGGKPAAGKKLSLQPSVSQVDDEKRV